MRRFRERILLTQFPVRGWMALGLPLRRIGRQMALDALYEANRALVGRRGPIRRLIRSGELKITCMDSFHYLGCLEHHSEKGRPLPHWHTMMNVGGMSNEIQARLKDWAIDRLGDEVAFNWKEVPDTDQEHVRRYMADGETKNNPRGCSLRRVTISSKGIPTVAGKTIEMPLSEYLALCEEHKRKPYSSIQYGLPKLLT